MGGEEMSDEEIKAHILFKMTFHHRWGGKHTELIHVRSALPPKCREKAEDLARELADAGFLTWLKKTGQIHISLNSHKKKEIFELLEKYYGKQDW